MTTKLICNRCGEYEQDCLCEPPVECEKCKKYASELSALQRENAELKSEADKEHAKAVELCDKLIDLRTQNRELREALKKLLQKVDSSGDWDDGCFYLNGKSASEFQKPMDDARKAIAMQPEK